MVSNNHRLRRTMARKCALAATSASTIRSEQATASSPPSRDEAATIIAMQTRIRLAECGLRPTHDGRKANGRNDWPAPPGLTETSSPGTLGPGGRRSAEAVKFGACHLLLRRTAFRNGFLEQLARAVPVTHFGIRRRQFKLGGDFGIVGNVRAGS